MKTKILTFIITTCFLLSGISIVTGTGQQGVIIPEIDPQTNLMIIEETNPMTTLEVESDLSGLLLQVTESMVLSYISALVAFGPRRTGTPACENAGNYIANTFTGMGLDVDSISWSSGSYSGYNIEGTLLGVNEDSDQLYLIIAHYDTVSGSPGADDNAAGTAAVMAAADVMSQYSFVHTVKFVCFDGEEQGLLGSYQYAGQAASNNDNIIEVINGDMIGYTETEYGRTHVKVGGSTIISSTAQLICDTYPDLLDLTVNPQGASGNSDHYPFIVNGFDAAMFHEQEFNDYYHSSQDTIAHMDMDYDMRVTRLELGTLAYFAGFIPQSPGGGGDVTLIPPIVTINDPVEGDYVQGTVTVEGAAHDFTTYVKSVLVKINDKDWVYAEIIESEGKSASWAYTFDSKQYPDGELRIRAVALNKKGTQSGVFNIGVNVSNTPLTGSISIPSTAITLEEVFFTSTIQGGAPPYIYAWDFGDGASSDQANPSHQYIHPDTYTVTLTVTDQAERTITRQATILIKPSDETPPALTIIQPGNGIYLNNNQILPFRTPVIIQSVEVVIEAEDAESGIDYLIISVDGTPQVQLHVEPYTWMYETEGFGQHTLAVEAFDIVGNSAIEERMVWTLF
jgi:PKD repeat protein